MSVLVCAATAFELATCPEWSFAERLVSGVGAPATFHALYGPHPPGPPLPSEWERGEKEKEGFPAELHPSLSPPSPILMGEGGRGGEGQISLILNIGIAGAYPDTGIAIGDIILVDGEVWGDVGMELPAEPGFLPIADTDFGREFYAAPLPTVITEALPRVAPPGTGFRVHVARGCTVNACTGTRAVGVRRAGQFGAGCETMEGAAVAQVGRDGGVPVCEIRAISNVAADRDMRPENIRRALANLRAYLETCGPVFAVFSS